MLWITLEVMRRALAFEPFRRTRAVVDAVIGRLLGKNIAENTSEPGPFCSGSARSLVQLGCGVLRCLVVGHHLWLGVETGQLGNDLARQRRQRGHPIANRGA